MSVHPVQTIAPPVRGRLAKWALVAGATFLAFGGLLLSSRDLLAVLLGQLATGPMVLDYIAQYTAGRALLEGQAPQLYRPEVQEAIQQRFLTGERPDGLFPFLNGPLMAFVAAPFAALPYPWAFIAWFVANCAMLAAATWLLAPTRASFWVGLALSLGFLPVLHTLIFGQTSLLTLLGTSLAVRATLEGRSFIAGLSWAVWAVKPHFLLAPAVAILLTPRRRMVLGLGAGLLLPLLTALVVLSPSFLPDYLRLGVWAADRALLSPALDHPGVTWLGFFQRALPSGSAAALGATLVADMVTLGAVAWLWRRSRAGRRCTLLLALATLPPAMLLLAPHAHEYEPTLCLVSAWLLAHYVRMHPDSRGIVTAAIAIGYLALDLSKPAEVFWNLELAALFSAALIGLLIRLELRGAVAGEQVPPRSIALVSR